MEEESYRFERKFVELAWSRAEKAGFTKRAFADKVFTEEAQPERKLQLLLRLESRSGKPQRLRLSEGYRMAEVLGIAEQNASVGVL